MWNYTKVKKLAKQQKGVRVKDLLALAPANDPFYTGRPSELEAAQWFAELWHKFSYGQGVHLRRVHYQIVSQSPAVQMPNGKGPYENTQNCWSYLNNAAKWARYLDLVPGEAFVDRRNPDAVLYARFYKPDDLFYEDPTPSIGVANAQPEEWEEYEVPELPELDALPWDLPDYPRFNVRGYEDIQQPFLIEIWAEKTTMNDVLIPLCRDYGLNLVTGAGELSITAVLDFLQRVKEADRPARILYVSDFDPAGLGMPISVARKIEYYMRKANLDLDIRLEPVVLTSDQVAQYNLPRVPVKDSDRRKANWVRDFGAGQTELDALEALIPGELRKIIRHAIMQYYDPELGRRARKEKARLKSDLYNARNAFIEQHTDELNALHAEYEKIQREFDTTRERFAELAQTFQPELDEYRERLRDIRDRGNEVYSKLCDTLTLHADGIDPEKEYPLPDPELPDESDGLLYDSRRAYLDQLAYYKGQRHNAKQLTLEVTA